MSKNKDHPFKILIGIIKLTKRYIPWHIVLGLIFSLFASFDIGVTDGIRRMINGTTQLNPSMVKTGLIIGLAFALGLHTKNIIMYYFSGILGHFTTLDLQLKLLSKLPRIKFRKIESYHSGDLIARINSSTSNAQSGVNGNLRAVILHIFTIIFTGTFIPA